MEKLKIKYPILVEGKYDKITLDEIVEGTILPIGGFSIYNQKEKQAFFRKLSSKGKLIVLTDPDGAGRQIRGYLNTILPKESLIHLYVPEVQGKEKRKEKAGKAGILGVEGINKDTLISLLLPFADTSDSRVYTQPITMQDFFEWGLTGGNHSMKKRCRVCEIFHFPKEISTKGLIEALSLLYDRDEVLQTLIEQHFFDE